MREGYGSRSVCSTSVCVASCYIPVLYVENKVPLGSYIRILKIRGNPMGLINIHGIHLSQGYSTCYTWDYFKST